MLFVLKYEPLSFTFNTVSQDIKALELFAVPKSLYLYICIELSTCSLSLQLPRQGHSWAGALLWLCSVWHQKAIYSLMNPQKQTPRQKNGAKSPNISLCPQSLYHKTPVVSSTPAGKNGLDTLHRTQKELLHCFPFKIPHNFFMYLYAFSPSSSFSAPHYLCSPATVSHTELTRYVFTNYQLQLYQLWTFKCHSFTSVSCMLSIFTSPNTILHSVARNQGGSSKAIRG